MRTAGPPTTLSTRWEEPVRGIHPYEVPEILAVPVATGSRAYLEWLDAELQ